MLAKMSFLWNDKTTCQKDDIDVSKSRLTKDDEEKPKKNVVTVVSEPKDDNVNVTSESHDDDVIKEAPKTSTPNVDRVADDSKLNDTKPAKDQVSYCGEIDCINSVV